MHRDAAASHSSSSVFLYEAQREQSMTTPADLECDFVQLIVCSAICLCTRTPAYFSRHTVLPSLS